MNKTRIAYLINRFFLHLSQGTLYLRIQDEWQERIKQRRREWWDSHKDRHDSFVYLLQKKVKINLYYDSVLCRLIYCDHFEWQERRFLNSYLRPGDIFFDIGANIGLFTLIASRRVGSSGTVYAFEPCAKTFQRLVDNVELNRRNNVECHQAALSDRCEQIPMNSSLDGYDAWNSLAPPIGGSDFTTEMVTSSTLDSFIHEHHLAGRIRMMKIDVEGWENRVLSGGMEIFTRKDAPVLQVEFTDKACQSAGSSCQALYLQLEQLGYRMFVYDAQRNRIVADPVRNSYPYLNLIATKNPDDIIARISNR